LARQPQAGTVRSRTDEFATRLYSATTETDERVVVRLQKVAAARSVPPARIALAWMLHQPGITAPIIGASKPHHLEDALAAPGIKLTTEEIKVLEEPYVPHAVVGHD
jgi:aryl-alcohol dehydrogenase-like predicted oxidoreductase